jgi:hypothetical protein
MDMQQHPSSTASRGGRNAAASADCAAAYPWFTLKCKHIISYYVNYRWSSREASTNKRNQLLFVVRMQRGSLGCTFIPNECISVCNTSRCVSFVNTIVDVSPDSDFLNTIHDESMRLHVLGIIIVRDDFGPVLRHYEVSLLITSVYLW